MTLRNSNSMIVSEVVRKYGKYRPVTRVGAVGTKPPRKFFASLEKCAGHSLKLLVIGKKFWFHLIKIFAPPPGVPSWLRSWENIIKFEVFCCREVWYLLHIFLDKIWYIR